MGGRANRRTGIGAPPKAAAPRPDTPERPATPKSTFPRRDPDGHVAHLRDLVVAVIVAQVVCLIALIGVDLVSGLTGLAHFGSSSGWLTGILSVWLFVEDLRSWRGEPLRWAVLALSVVAGVLVAAGSGYAAYALLHPLTGHASLAIGAIGATAGALAYAPVWFFGIRYVEKGAAR